MKKIVILFLVLIQVVSLKATDCEIYPFDKCYQENINNQEIYFIRGIKLETIYHGIKVLVIDNYKENLINDTIMVWCSDGNSARIANSNWYSDNDTLILLVTKTDFEGNDPRDSNDIPDTLEQAGDFMPILCSYSILNNKSDSVIGRITSVASDTIVGYNNFFSYLISSLNIIPNFEQRYVSVFPNPTYNYLIFELKNTDIKGCGVQILNINGQLIDSFILPTNQICYQYDVSNLIKGIYMINIYNKGNIVSNQKLIKQ
jgi:hypothetical protein